MTRRANRDRMTEEKRKRIEHLLRTTEMTMTLIARRMEVNTSSVGMVNKQCGYIRKYRGKQSDQYGFAAS